VNDADRFEAMVRLDELKAMEAKMKDPSIILAFNVEDTFAYYDAKGWDWIRKAWEGKV
jgi:hypothetical protein